MHSSSLFPQSCEVLQLNPSGLQSQISWVFSVPLPDPQVGKSAVSPRTFATVQELLSYNCTLVSGSSAQRLTGANGSLLQKVLCHMPHLLGLLQPELPSPWQVTADPCLCRRHSNTQRQVWLSLLWMSLLHSLGPGVPEVLFAPSEHL